MQFNKMKCEDSELKSPSRYPEGTQAYSKTRHMFYIVKKYADGSARWLTNSGMYVLPQELPDDAIVFEGKSFGLDSSFEGAVLNIHTNTKNRETK